MSGVDETNNTGGNGLPPKKTLEDLLKLLALNQEPEKPKKKEDYKFWKTQPVPNFDEKFPDEGPIEKLKTPDDVPDTPYPLPKEFEWSTLNLDNDKDMDELYELLHENYVEDSSETFRFKYSKSFFNWGLKPPGWHKDLHVGVRVKESQRLVGFIGGIPLDLELHGRRIKTVEINFLCAHKKLRNKRLTPVLIKEVTRRVNKKNIWQAFYTAGVVLPSPVSVSRYTHRPINFEKLNDVEFSGAPPGKTIQDMCDLYKLPENTSVKGLRKAEFRDVDQLFDLYNRYHSRYEIIQRFDKDEIAHYFIGSSDPEKSIDTKNSPIVTYVVEDEETKRITDFFSFYLLPFSVLDNPKHDTLNVAYLFYYASDIGLDKEITDKVNQAKLAARLIELMNDALIIAKDLDIDVFNAVTSQDNPLFLSKLKFGLGDGFLNYYLFNWKTFPINGGIDKENKELTGESGGIGVVML